VASYNAQSESRNIKEVLGFIQIPANVLIRIAL
jgi:hypothetical protein